MIKNLGRIPSPSRLILAAIILHLVMTLGIFLGGRLRVLPGVDENGVARATDSIHDLTQARSLADNLVHREVTAWLAAAGGLHVKLYSIPLVILDPLFGTDILSVEPINLLCYIGILCLTFKIGKEVFDRGTGLKAAIMVGLWPSFLLHTTQLLRDPLFIVALLLLVLVLTSWLTRTLSLLMGLATGVIAGSAAYVISLTRSGFWAVIVLAITFVGFCLLVVRIARERRVLAGNTLSAMVVLLAAGMLFWSAKERPWAFYGVIAPPGSTSSSIEAKATNSNEPGSEQTSVVNRDPAKLSLKDRADLVALQLFQMRQEFVRLNGYSGSNIDRDVQFNSAVDVLRYLPRAIMIGFLAPFPNQWFARGEQVGLVGRLISGVEMTIIYLIEVLALMGLWRSRSSLSAWLLFCTSVTGIVALALVIINIGALYRVRYVFFILVIILGAKGLSSLAEHARTQAAARA